MPKKRLAGKTEVERIMGNKHSLAIRLSSRAIPLPEAAFLGDIADTVTQNGDVPRGKPVCPEVPSR